MPEERTAIVYMDAKSLKRLRAVGRLTIHLREPATEIILLAEIATEAAPEKPA